MSPLSLLTGRVWQAASIGATAIAFGLGVKLAFVTMDRNHLRDQIENPATGYKVRLTTAEGNVTRLGAAIDEQNKAIDAAAAKGQQKLADAEILLAKYQRDNGRLDERLKGFLSKPLAGETSCARIEDADKALLEMLK